VTSHTVLGLGQSSICRDIPNQTKGKQRTTGDHRHILHFHNLASPINKLPTAQPKNYSLSNAITDS
jgi:hypothetical protein